MTIERYTPYFNAIIPDANGEYVEFEDHLEATEDLEYLIRTLNEEKSYLQDEVNYWKEKYFEYYEQDQL